jgi:hypothetical protein
LATIFLVKLNKHKTKHDLVIFFLKKEEEFEEKINKLLDHLNISRISGIWPYQISGRISGRAIWYPAGYWI